MIKPIYRDQGKFSIYEIQPGHRTLQLSSGEHNTDSVYVKFPWTYFVIKYSKIQSYILKELNLYFSEHKLQNLNYDLEDIIYNRDDAENGRVYAVEFDTHSMGDRSICLGNSFHPNYFKTVLKLEEAVLNTFFFTSFYETCFVSLSNYCGPVIYFSLKDWECKSKKIPWFLH